ncbi:MAG TPA: ABC transporter permease, partial [Chitinophagaceae bacterium]|nr:ABC transporter permease [Chitinophagaceae bacterium]
MRTLKFLLQKEFLQIFRNKSILMVILVLPVVQLLILPLAANYEVKNIRLTVVDHDHSEASGRLISAIGSSGYFTLAGLSSSFSDGMKMIEADRADLLLEIPGGFNRNLVRQNGQKLFIAINAINGVKASLGGAYLNQIIQTYNGEVQPKLVNYPASNLATGIEITSANWFNPLMNYKLFMVPGILAMLITMIGMFLSAMNIVREKELGTIEQINVTPVKKYQFILGKLIPFWVLGMVVLVTGLSVTRVVYGILPEGSIVLLFAFVAVYLLAVLGLGLLISTYSETQQQAMFVAFFFMIIFILMGGLFTSIDSMPPWAQVVTRFNPVRYL